MDSKKIIWLAILLCVLAAVGLQSLTLSSPPLFDDKYQLTASNIFKEYQGLFTARPRWLSYGTFAWTHSIAGDSWWVFRLQNVLLHAATVLSLLYFYRKLFKRIGVEDSQAVIMAGAGALLFAVHPVSVYAVSYLIQRSIVMATLFSILTLVAVLKAFESGKLRWLGVAALMYILAMSSKEYALMLPLVVWAMTFVADRDRKIQSIRRYLVYGIVLFIGALAVVGWQYRELIASPFDMASRQLIERLATGYPTVGEHAYLLSIINEAYLYFKYLILWLLPMPDWMSIDMRQPFPTELLSWPQIIGPLMFLAYGLAGIALLRKGGAKGLLGFGMLVPWLLYPTEFATVWIQDPFVLYRSYLWLIGMPAIIPFVYAGLGRQPSMALFVFIALVFTWASLNKLETFKGEYALWDDAVRYNEQVALGGALGKERAYNERALGHAQAGRYEDALADYSKAIDINPKDPSVYANRAALLILLEREAEAKADLDRALKLDPKHPRARFNLASLYARTGKGEMALKELNDIISTPESVTSEAYAARGTLLMKQRAFDQAVRDFSDAIIMHVDDAGTVYAKRGSAKLALGDGDGALADYNQALALKPNQIDIRNNRALLVLRMGRRHDALADADAAVALDPTSTRSHLVRAQIYVSLGRMEDAIAEYGRVLETNPNDAMAYLNRGEVSMAMGRIKTARADLEAACKRGLQQGCDKLAAMRQ